MLLLERYQERILRYMGQPSGEVSKDLQELLQKAYASVEKNIQPKSVWKVLEKKDIALMIRGKNLENHFKQATHGAVFVVTLGEDMEKLIEEGKARSTMEGLIFEAIGSVYVEAAVEDLRCELQQEWKGMLSAFSPGYGDCPLSLHREILELLDRENHLGIQVTNHNILTPRKTITGFIPLSKDANGGNRSSCEDCNMDKDCVYRDEKIILFDGGMGTELQRHGFGHLENLTSLNITHPTAVLKVHQGFVKAGAEYVSTNTFGANAIKIQDPYVLKETIKQGVELAKKANPKKVFLDVGPLGVLMKPQGEFTFEQAYRIFQETIRIGLENGVDGILLETFTDLYEIKAAIYAAKEQTSLPVYATMSFEKNGRTFLGLQPKVALRALEAFGADVVGINCSVGPKEMIPWIRESIPYLSKPVLVQGNAGLPFHQEGKEQFHLSSMDYAAYTEELVDLGVKIIGGCCGTGTKTIKAVSDALKDQVYRPPERVKTLPFTCSYNEGVFIERPIIVGERINPTGKAVIEEALRSHNYSEILQEAVLQKKEGAKILDVNVGLSGVKEEIVLPEVIEEIQQVVSTPLQIDTSDVQALEKALRIYNGVPIINSVNGGQASMDTVLPLGEKYGCSIIALTFDDQGLPKTAEKRVQIAKRIIARAKELGMPKERIIFDPLALTVAHEADQAKESLKALRIIKEDLGCKTILGLSNISYGMPQRSRINQSFLTLALYEGLDLLLMDPGDQGMNEALASFTLLSNQDPQGKNFTGIFRASKESMHNKEPNLISWKSLLLDGNPKEFEKALLKWIKDNPVNLSNYEYFVEQELLQAFDQIGDLYDREEVFLPQLIQAAEVLKSGLRLIHEETLSIDFKKNFKKKDRILLATVEGDLHDIGKNIFHILVENYGYAVTDLGKDVKTETVLKEMKENDFFIVGLSALMTTTLGSMEKTIKAIKTRYPNSKIIVGGAVLTENYAKVLGADAYAKDAREGVYWVKKWTAYSV